jgi:Clp amino terminal domain, pathogenicity island component
VAELTYLGWHVTGADDSTITIEVTGASAFAAAADRGDMMVIVRDRRHGFRYATTAADSQPPSALHWLTDEPIQLGRRRGRGSDQSARAIASNGCPGSAGRLPWRQHCLDMREVERMNHREEAVNWSLRYKANLEKLASQDLANVTEVVRDLELRERQHGLSAGEKRMLDKARHLRQLLSDADAAEITHQPFMQPAGQADDRGQAEGTARIIAERLTDRARRVVVVLAEEEARMRGHDWIGTEHLLLGLIQDGNGSAIKALKSLGISLEAARQQVDEIIGTGQQVPRAGRLPFTPRSRKVLELSSDEAQLLGHDYVSTGHILLGLIRDSDGVAGQVLATLGADLTTARQQVTELLLGYRGGDEPGTGRAARRSGKAGRGRRKLLSEILGRLDSMESRLRAIEHRQLPPEP